MNPSNLSRWVEVAHSVGEEFAARAEAHDKDDTFVGRNYAALKERLVFSAAIPAAVGECNSPKDPKALSAFA